MKVIKNRIPIIKNYCRKKTVLDVGCIQHKAIKEESPFWLHKHIKEVAKKVKGIDILKEEAKELNKKGYNIIIGNAEEIKLSNKFEVIVAGEIIEHISNKGKFLENMYYHLKKEGHLILTTPNLFALRYQIRNFLNGNVIPNKEHVCWFDYYTLKELCERHSFKLEKSFYFFNTNTPFYKYLPVKITTLFRKNY